MCWALVASPQAIHLMCVSHLRFPATQNCKWRRQCVLQHRTTAWNGRLLKRVPKITVWTTVWAKYSVYPPHLDQNQRRGDDWRESHGFIKISIFSHTKSLVLLFLCISSAKNLALIARQMTGAAPFELP